MIQDILWVDDLRQQILSERCYAYFAPEYASRFGPVKELYAILALDKQITNTNLAAWRRLTSDGNVQLKILTNTGKPDITIPGYVVEDPDSIDVLRSHHQVRKHELVIRLTSIPDNSSSLLATYHSRSEADKALKMGYKH